MTKNFFWIFDALGRILGGLIAYFFYSTGKDTMYVFVASFVGCFLVGAWSVFMVLTLNVDGAFFLYMVAIFMGLGQGGSWVTIA